MDAQQLCGIILLVIVSVVGEPLTVDNLTRRQNQLTMDTFLFFQEQIEVHVYYIEQRITELKEKVRILEGSSAGTGGEDTRPIHPDETYEPYEPEPEPEPEPGQPEPEPGQPDSGRGQPDRVTRPPKKPGKPGKKPKPEPAATTTRPAPQPTTVYKVPTTPARPTYDRTCAEIFNNGYTFSGDYTVDPDWDGPIEPFTVFCDMESGEGVTRVGHNTEQPDIPVNGYENPGSFNLQPVYANGATMEQLGALADASKTCKQFVKYACKNSGIMEVDKASGLTYAWWVDRNGDKHVNFGGAPTDSGKCACAFGGPNGDENTCFQGSETCNCDHKKAKNQLDQGEFSDKGLLPVMSINLGDTGSKKERGAVTLGKFVCEG